MSALDAVRARQSWSKVGDTAPGREELLALVAAAGRVADHSSLRPWRLIELRGADREALGAAIAQAQGDDSPSTKPLRAPLLIAVVASYQPSEKVPRWEQEAVASGVAHVLSLLLDEAGWGVIWRTGHFTRSQPVAAMHGLADDEELLGWLYVGDKPPGKSPGRRKAVDARRLLTRLPSTQPAVAAAEPAELAENEKKAEANAEKKSAKKAKKKAKKAAKKAKKKAAKENPA
ncbi:nitroreductase family protein [Microbacterium sp. SSW1-47]|uniref:nitroreductase family protein n=1 Tax=Microbacterium sufflavum TaxID=2851649 RepID=UPI001FFD3A51|nr:nitroreductase family protein [Microbacterium sufflavum]MCK2024707.1 nitroreductase family protein [Microbacterium sufflavum]